jgi:hypothetical protein
MYMHFFSILPDEILYGLCFYVCVYVLYVIYVNY